MFPTQPIAQAASTISAPDLDSTTAEQKVPVTTDHNIPDDSLYYSKCMQLIWNEVNRLTVLGVIRSEEDKWFFAYRKAIGILEGDE